MNVKELDKLVKPHLNTFSHKKEVEICGTLYNNYVVWTDGYISKNLFVIHCDGWEVN